MLAQDGMEISFEIEVDGEETVLSDVEPSDETLDPLSSELMSTYESIAANTQEHSLTNVDHSSDDAHDPEHPQHQALFNSPAPAPVQPQGEREHRVNALMDRLSFLSDDLLEEVKRLVFETGDSAAPQSLPASPPHSAPGQMAMEDFEVADRVRDSEGVASRLPVLQSCSRICAASPACATFNQLRETVLPETLRPFASPL